MAALKDWHQHIAAVLVPATSPSFITENVAISVSYYYYYYWFFFQNSLCHKRRLSLKTAFSFFLLLQEIISFYLLGICVLHYL